MAHSFKVFESDVVGKWHRQSWKYTASGTSFPFTAGAAQTLKCEIYGTSTGVNGLEIARQSGTSVVLSGLVDGASYNVIHTYI